MNEPKMTKMPEVSVVIPTRFRPRLVERAIKSALAQTFQNLEVIVVIDGPDSETEQILRQIYDNRVRIFKLPENKGASHARNKGVDCASGTWIAFLDDDDEWMKEKIEMQLLVAQEITVGCPVVACRLFVQTESGSYLSPRRLPGALEPISEYLFVRKGLFRGEGSITTSMLTTTKALLQRYPFDENLKRHQEADWLLRVAKYDKLELRFVEKPLCILHAESDRPRISETGDWLYSFKWCKERKGLLTPKAYSAFLLTAVSAVAAREKSWSAFFMILREATSAVPLSSSQLRLFLGIWLVPQALRTRIRVKWLRIRQLNV